MASWLHSTRLRTRSSARSRCSRRRGARRLGSAWRSAQGSTSARRSSTSPDYFGSSVVIARRLCDSGGAGQIRASDLVVRLLAGRGDVIHSNDLGALELKGITAPVSAVEIVYEHDPMALLRRLPFVAREAEYETLIRKLAEAGNSRGLIVMLAGEPGIGKTRLAEEFCDQASSSAMMIRGNCYEGDASPPFGPWVEALRSLVERLAPEVLRDALGTTAAEIAVLVPELRRKLPDIGEPLKLHPEAERARLFDAVATVLKNASQRKSAHRLPR